MGGVKLYDMSMREVSLRGVKWLEFTPDPPTAEETTEKVYNGDIPMGKTRNSRLIQAKLWYKAYDVLDYKLLRDELFSFLSPFQEFYVVDEDVPGKRWKVSVRDIQPERINRTTAEVAVVFYCPRGLSESIAMTMDGIDTVYGDWASGMGLESDVGTQDYTHSSDFFGIHNAGNVMVDPRESELSIRIDANNGGSGKLTVRNMSTSEEWIYTGPLNAGDTITIDRMESKRNYSNIVGQTNLNLISLVPGQNAFLLSGINQGFEISFNFRYLYE
ncbi:phage tail domain-containing protein [Planococcus sp. SE5232]|uniref:phage tail domain-containing protein n=1 Tax=unclassified Planococcus (in: firmicutes) TaxID=2662419 RepID=UPI003D6A80AB